MMILLCRGFFAYTIIFLQINFLRHMTMSYRSGLNTGSMRWLLVVFLLAFAPSVKAEYFTYMTNNAAVTILGYTGSGSAVNIPETVNGFPVTSIGDSAFTACTNVVSITISSNVCSIGAAAFDGCTSLVNVKIPDTVTNIGDHAFSYCTSINKISIPRSVVSIGLLPFEGCCTLTAISVDALNLVYSSADGVLFNRGQSKLIQFPQGKMGGYKIPKSVIGIADHAFLRCNGLSSIMIGNNVASIGDESFFACSSLSNVIISSGVDRIGRMAFAFCTNLSSITVDVFNPEYNSVDGILYNKTRTSLIQYPGGKAGHFKVPDSVTNIENGALPFP